MTRYRLDPSTRLVAGADLLLGGSPLRLFRLTAHGRRRVESLAAGDDIASPSPLVERLVGSGAIHPDPMLDAARLAQTTIVIPTHAPDLAHLQALVDTCRHAAAVVVVDDASTDPVPEIDGASMIRLDANQGPAAARNAGARAASTSFIAFVDDDVTVDEPAWLPLLLGHFDDPTVVAAAPRVRSRPGDGHLARFERAHSPLDLGPLPGVVGPGRRVGYLPAAALVVRRDAFEAAGGFDARLRFGEDVDIVWRLTGDGGRCRYEPRAEVQHLPRSSWRRWVRQRFDYGSSAAPLAARHQSALAPVRTTGWSAAIWVLVSCKRPLVAAGLAAFTTAALVRKVSGLPAGEAIRLTGFGHLYAGRTLAKAVRRVWWPLFAIGAARSRWCRRVLILSIASAVADWGRAPGDLGAGLLDDLSYGAGVWNGVLGERQLGPLLPEIITWPGSNDDQ